MRRTAGTRSASAWTRARLQWDLGPDFGIKAGYRYIDSFNNVRQFGADANTDTKAWELGAVFRI